MRQATIWVLLLLASALWGIEYQWPVKEIRLTGTFGENRYDHFHSGIDLGAGEQDIYPVSEGELIFAYEEGGAAARLPSGMGSFAVVEHLGGVRSLYAHLKRGSLAQGPYLLPDQALGVMGETGSSLGVHLHFTIIDSDTDNIINPLLLLPPIVDSARPNIRRISLEQGRDSIPLDGETPVLSAGEWELVIDLYDQSDLIDHYWPMAPFRVTVYLNGSEAVYLTYESLQFQGDHHVLVKSPGFSYADFYRTETEISLGRITLNRGETQIEVVASDFYGNEVVAQRSVVVR